VKEWEEDSIHVNQEGTRLAVLITDKIDFNLKTKTNKKVII
jgi:hypothetical protein